MMSEINIIDDMGTLTDEEKAVLDEQFESLMDVIQTQCNGKRLAAVLPALCGALSLAIRTVDSGAQKLIMSYCVGEIEKTLKDEGQVK